jgi:O-antigen ligase
VKILLLTVAAAGAIAICIRVLRRDAGFAVLASIFIGSTLTGIGQVGAGQRSLVPADVLVAAVAFLLLFRLVFTQPSRPARLGPLRLLPAWPIALALCGLLILPASTAIRASLGEVGAYAVLGGYCLLGMAAVRVDENVRFDWVLLAAFCLQVLLAAGQLVSGRRLTGGFGLPNQFAAFLILLVPIALHYGVRERRRIWLGVLLLIIPLMLGAGSRTALVTSAILSAVYFGIAQRRGGPRTARRPMGPLIIVGLCVLPVAYVAVQQTLPRWTAENHLTLFAREEQRGETPLLFHKSNFSQGIAAFRNRPATGSALSPRVSQYAAERYEVHDNFVGMLAQLGIFGLVFLVALLVGIWRLWRVSRGDTEMRAYVAGIAGVLIGMGMFHYTLRQRFVWVAVGYVAVAIVTRRAAAQAAAANNESTEYLPTPMDGS